MSIGDGRVNAFMVTYHRVEATIRAIDALLAQTRPPDTVLVVNNGGPDDGAAIASARPAVRLLDVGDNVGPAGGWALAIADILATATDDDWILFADDETPPPESTTIERLVDFAFEQFGRDPAVAGVGNVGGRFDRRVGAAVRLGDDELTDTVEVDTIGGGHWPLLRVAAIRTVEAPDASLFFGFEELEYFLKVREAGGRLLIDGDTWRSLRARHERVGLTISALRSAQPPAWRAYYSTRNSILIARRFGARQAPWRAAGRGGARMVRAVTRRRGRDAWAHACGVTDGVLGRRGRRWQPPN